MNSKWLAQVVVGLSLNVTLGAVAADAVLQVPEGHGVRLLLIESAQASKQVLMVSNGSAWPVRIRLMTYDQSGQLLTSRAALVDKTLAVALSDLHPLARSMAVAQEPGQAAEVSLTLPARVGLRADESAVRHLLLPPAQASAAPVTVYNPGSEPAQVQIAGANQQSIYLKPNQVETLTAAPGPDGLAVTASSNIVVQSGAVTSTLFGFREPVKAVTVLPQCEIGGACSPKGVGLHSGRDYMAGPVGKIPSSSTTDLILAVNFGRLARYIDFDTVLAEGGQPSHEMGNTVVLEHVLQTGDRLLSLYAHMEKKLLVDFAIGARVAKGQILGIIGCSGKTLTQWCEGSTNRHVHVELKNTNLGGSDLWPFGYMNQTEADSLKRVGDPAVLPIFPTALSRVVTTVSALQKAPVAQVLLPYLSRSAPTPGTASYDVFGLVGSPLVAAIALQPTSSKTFTNVGVGGRQYATDTAADAFLCTSATLSSTSVPLTSGSKECVGPKGSSRFDANDYRFYAYSDAATGFGRTGELKFSVLPANSELVDNDGLLTDTTGSQITAARQGYYVADESGALDVPGYYLSAKLFTAGSANFARWFPMGGRTFEVWAHVPKGASATAVTYKIYPRGRPADGSCVATHATNPCHVSDSVNHSSNQDAWVRLRSGSLSQFVFTASATNGAYVGLAATAAATGLIGVDAVKFIAPSVAPTAPTELSATPASANQVNLGWMDKSADETGFKIERRVGAGTWVAVATAAANAVSYADTGLSPATTYAYQVRAVNGALESANAGPVSATTLPAAPVAPSGLAASVLGSSQIKLTWLDNSSNETGFVIERRVGSAAWGVVATLVAQTVSYTDSGLSPATAYSYQVRALNGVTSSAASNIVTRTTSDVPPVAPSSPSATPNKATQVTLAWTDNSNNETGFKIERRQGLGAWSQIASVAANITAYVDGSVIGSRTYGYRLRATNSAGDSAYTVETKVTTPR